MHWTHRARAAYRPAGHDSGCGGRSWHDSHRADARSASALCRRCWLNPPGGRTRMSVTDWNVIAINATAVPPNSILQSRVLAIVHGAIYDAVRAVDQKSAAYAVDLKAPAGTSVDAAIAAAAHGALVRLAPAQRPMLDAALNAALSKIADGRGKTDGIRIGSQIAEKIVALRSSDRSDAKVAFTPKPGAGLYQLTPPQFDAGDPSAMGRRHALRPAQQERPRIQGAARHHERRVRARLRRGQERRCAQQHDANSRPDGGGDLLDGADGRSLVCGRACRLGGEKPVGVRERQAVRAPVDGDRRFPDRGLRREIQAPALAADHGHPRGGRSQHSDAQGRSRTGSRSW